MPYKDIGKRNKASKARMQKMRQGVTDEGVTEVVPASYVEGAEGRKYEALPERPRYLKLSDGQVLDRLNQPEAHASGDFRMQRCNESSYNYVPNESSKERVKAMVKEATR